jgi:tetratricopeptide (TPR) repeat protein
MPTPAYHGGNKGNQWIRVVASLMIVILIMAAFWPLKDCQFVNFDDDVYVYENGCIKEGLTWDCIQWAFSSESIVKGSLAIWHPVTWISLMLDHGLFGLNPSGYHLINLLLHILNSILVFFIFQQMTSKPWQSFLVAALFAVHPLHVESVAWISERKDVLSMFFFMLAIGTYVSYAKQKRTCSYFLSITLFAIGLMAKPMLVTLPMVLILLDYWPLNRFHKDGSSPRQKYKWLLIFEKVPYFALSVIFSVISYITQKKAGALDAAAFSLAYRIENALHSCVGYLTKTIWPVDLAVLYPLPQTFPLWQTAVYLLIVLGISLYVVIKMRKYPYLFVGWSWYLITILPVIGLVQLGHQASADRYTYIPLIGIFIMVIWGASVPLRHITHSRSVMGMAAGVLLLMLVVITQNQVGYWKDSITLMSRAIAVNKNNYIAHYYLGDYLIKHDQTEEAINHFEEALRINPYYYYPRNDLIRIYRQKGETDKAPIHLNEIKKIQAGQNK